MLCPCCGSDRVYPLMNTPRCKRCKAIWKESDHNRCPACAIRTISPPAPEKKRPAPLQKRLETKLEECLARSGGRFCPDTLHWQDGDSSRELFLKYGRRCVKERTLESEKDRYGRTWYRRPR